jgi:hypothetical protein
MPRDAIRRCMERVADDSVATLGGPAPAAGDPEDAVSRVSHLRVERGTTDRPQEQEDGQSEERDADHDTHQGGMGEDQNCGADRCC